jgi:hypothetical protein
MSVEFTCDRCGAIFTSNFIGGTTSVYMADNPVKCPVPRCSGWGHHKTGTYDFVNGIVKVFTAPGITRQNLDDASSIVKEASTGSITNQDAIQRLEAISATLAKAIAQSGQPKINWEFILALLVCIYTIWSDRGSDEAAQSALKEAQTQTAISQKMLEATLEQNKYVRESKTTPALRRQTPIQTSGTKNRHERRKQNAIQNRTQKKPPIA